MNKDDIISVLCDNIKNTPKWVFKSFIDELSKRKINEPLMKFYWIDENVFNTICNVLSEYQILGQTFIVGVAGYRDIDTLLKEGYNGSDIDAVSYWKKIDIL